jgi:tRNA (guanine37-N1)-methyltransferase
MALWTRRFATCSIALQKMNSPNLPEIFLPPSKRDMHELDRSFFKKTIPLSAATIFEKRNIAKVRAELLRSGDILSVGSIKVTRDDQTTPGQKCMLLKPAVDATGTILYDAGLYLI